MSLFNQGEFEELEERTIEWNHTFRERLLAAVKVAMTPQQPPSAPSSPSPDRAEASSELVERLRTILAVERSAVDTVVTGVYVSVKTLEEAADALTAKDAQLTAQQQRIPAEARVTVLTEALQLCLGVLDTIKRALSADELWSTVGCNELITGAIFRIVDEALAGKDAD